MLQLVDAEIKNAGLLLANLALGLVPGDVVAAHSRCELVPFSKPGRGAGLRPLQLGSVCRRIAMGGLVKYISAAIEEAVGPDQLAFGVQDGCVKAFQEPHLAVLAENCVSAHQTLHRAHCCRPAGKALSKIGSAFSGLVQ